LNILFNNQDISFSLKNKKKIKNWIKAVIANEKSMLGNINFIFCSDAFLLEINNNYLQHDFYTDIITFDYSENDTISGDIYISVDRVSDNAKSFEQTFENEMLRVLIHGVLHLLKFDDKTEELKKQMTTKEDEALKLFTEITQ